MQCSTFVGIGQGGQVSVHKNVKQTRLIYSHLHGTNLINKGSSVSCETNDGYRELPAQVANQNTRIVLSRHSWIQLYKLSDSNGTFVNRQMLNCMLLIQ